MKSLKNVWILMAIAISGVVAQADVVGQPECLINLPIGGAEVGVTCEKSDRSGPPQCRVDVKDGQFALEYEGQNVLVRVAYRDFDDLSLAYLILKKTKVCQ